MDFTDAKIVELLQDNARISISEISKSVNMSLSAVSERLKKLEMSGLIERYTALINPHYLGQELMVIMNLCLEEEQKQNFRKFVGEEKEILECHYITGEYDINLKIVTKNTVSLEQLINKVKSFPGVGRSQTNVVLSSFKNNCSIGPIVDPKQLEKAEKLEEADSQDKSKVSSKGCKATVKGCTAKNGKAKGKIIEKK